MKKEEVKKVEKRQKPRAKPAKVIVDDEHKVEEEMSIKEMLHGKRKPPPQNNTTVPKRAKTVNMVTTKKFGEKDFKIFGAHKLKK